MNTVAKPLLGVAFLRQALHALATLVFLVLLFLRPVIRFVLLILPLPCFIWVLILWGSHGLPHQHRIMLEWAAFGFGAYALAWFYDQLILRLAPGPIVLY